ncbi:MAG: hypothetical protein IJD05_06860 [Bacteroidaceae bacterium]|nr:hypothetical protein [Bacteroidaceae bacterium]
MEQELLTLIKNNIKKYPDMQLQDCVKLLYQHSMGNEHLGLSMDKCLEFLIAEKENIGCNNKCSAYDIISNNSCRFHLLPLDNDKVTLATLSKLFIKSAETLSYDKSSQKEKLITAISLLKNWCLEGRLPFSYAEADSFLTEYIKKGCPAVHHSQIYRDTYHPAYRLIRTDFAKYFSLFVAIDRLLTQKPNVVIAIDGKCGGGKSTLASLLAEIYSANIIHMDDFYLPAELRTPKRLTEIGGNIHYERFTSQVFPVLCKLKNTDYKTTDILNDHYYQIFDCHLMDYTPETATISAKPVTIVEGSYSLRPEFRDAYDLKVFLDLSPEMQKERLLARNGAEAYKNFELKWIPMELRYFEGYHIADISDYIYTA